MVLAVNKMDLVGFDEARFGAIAADVRALAAELSLARVTAIPISARDGDNVTREASGRPIIPARRCLSIWRPRRRAAARRAGRSACLCSGFAGPNQDFRGFAGPVLSGRVAVGDEVVVAALGPREPRRRGFWSARTSATAPSSASR